MPASPDRLAATQPSPGPDRIAGTSAASAARPRWVMMVLVVWAGLYALLLAVKRQAVLDLSLHDPDDLLRLQQVRDLLAGQGWFDLHQYRIDAAAGGVAMHWSRIVDGPLAAAILAFRPLLGEAGAERAALIVVPGLTLLAILMLVGWIGARVLPRGANALAVLVTAFAVPVMVQVLPGRIDHHGWQIALALAALAGFLVSGHRRGGWISGAALAGWMAISFEGLPLSAWVVAVTAIGALAMPELKRRLTAMMQALAAVSAGLFLLTRGTADLAAHCDAIAPMHLAAFGWGALVITLAHRLRPHSSAAWLAGLGAAGIGALALVAAAAPQCATGSFDMLDPLVREIWYDNVREGKPVWASSWSLAVQYILPALIGLAATAALAHRSHGELRRWWIFYGLILAGALAIAVIVARAASIPAIMAVLPLGWLVSRWLGSLRRPANPLLRVGELLATAGLIVLALLPSLPVGALEKVLNADAAAVETAKVAAEPCRAQAARTALAMLPAGGVLAPLDLGPDLLVNTDRAVLATGHHRGAAAIRTTIDIFSGTPERARTAMAGKGLRYLAVCPGMDEMAIYAERSPGGFAAQLEAGRIPGWLVPVALPANAPLELWRVAD